MLQSFITSLLKRRHFWRYASFDEVAELYASRVMRLLAQNMISLFTAVYLYQNHFSLVFIAFYLAGYYLLRAIIAYPAAQFVARFGPKHAILLGNLLYIPALVCFTFVPTYGIGAVIAFGVIQAWSMTAYLLGYTVDFSKVKHSKHAGKEIGFMSIFEKIGTGLSPLLGGAIAFMFGAEATMWFSAVLFAIASWPLLRTAEQVKTAQKIDFSGFPWRMTYRSLIADSAVGVDIVASSSAWVLFLAVAVFAGSGDGLYLKIGAFASVTIATSFLAAFVFGRIIDRRRGADLLRVGVIMDSLTHLFRAFVTTPTSVVAANVTNEVATTAFSMAFTRGIFDLADRSGKRIVYMYLLEVSSNLGAALACVVLGIFIIIFPTATLALQFFFGFAAVYVLLLMTGRFSLSSRTI